MSSLRTTAKGQTGGRLYAGEPWGSYLAEWLNGHLPSVNVRYVAEPQKYHSQPTTVELKRVTKLIELISKVEDQLADFAGGEARPISGPMGDGKVRRVAEKVAKALGRYQFNPHLRFRPFQWRARGKFRFHLRVGYQGASGEDLAVQWIISVLEEGCFDHLRHCRQCGTWLFAHFAPQKFCSSRCEKQYREQSPEYKAEHRKVALRSYHNRRKGIGGWRKDFGKR